MSPLERLGSSSALTWTDAQKRFRSRHYVSVNANIVLHFLCLVSPNLHVWSQKQLQMHIILDTTKGILEGTVKLCNTHMITNNLFCLDVYFLIFRRRVPCSNSVKRCHRVFQCFFWFWYLSAWIVVNIHTRNLLDSFKNTISFCSFFEKGVLCVALAIQELSL